MGKRKAEQLIQYDCPTCNSSRIKVTARQVAEDVVLTTASCLDCGHIGGTVEDTWADWDTAIALWNRAGRAALKAAEERDG